MRPDSHVDPASSVIRTGFVSEKGRGAWAWAWAWVWAELEGLRVPRPIAPLRMVVLCVGLACQLIFASVIRGFAHRFAPQLRFTPLIRASERGHKLIVELLIRDLDSRANVRRADAPASDVLGHSSSSLARVSPHAGAGGAFASPPPSASGDASLLSPSPSGTLDASCQGSPARSKLSPITAAERQNVLDMQDIAGVSCTAYDDR